MGAFILNALYGLVQLIPDLCKNCFRTFSLVFEKLHGILLLMVNHLCSISGFGRVLALQKH